MSRELAVPAALDVLTARIQEHAPPVDLLQILRTLQRHGVSQIDLQIHVERIRAMNDLTDEDPDLEETAGIALDIIAGHAGDFSLRWDPVELAKLFLPKVVDEEALRASVEFAFVPSDLLPPRPADNPPSQVVDILIERQLRMLESLEASPSQADFYRVPKVGFASRPAALLAPYDRLLYEALCYPTAQVLHMSLPSEVVWPRSRERPPPHDEFANLPLEWGSDYIVKADLDSFYECVDHGLLTTFLSRHLHFRTSYLHALEAFLTAVMGTEDGLPQGQPASDVFSSAYLLPIDRRLSNEGWSFVRYADDYYFAASSVVEGRLRLEQFEALLRELGLRLNVTKTRIMRTETYRAGTSPKSPRVEALRKRVRAITEERLRETEDPEELEQVLSRVGVDQEVLWDLLYHHTVTLDEVLQGIGEELTPSLAESYAQYFDEVAATLKRGTLPEDMLSAEKDLIECLVFLASSTTVIPLESVQTALRWFPRLARYVATYLASTAAVQLNEVRQFLGSWLDPPADSDWVTSWLCQVAERVPELVGDQLQPILESTSRNPDVGLLTRSSAVRALAAGGSLSRETWMQLFSDATQAIRSEMLFAALADPEHYSWVPYQQALDSGPRRADDMVPPDDGP
jgi:hypothetical protein